MIEPTNWWKTRLVTFIAEHTRAGSVKRGMLEVLVANSTLVQELTYQKEAILQKIVQLLPDEKIEGLRFKVGRIK